MVAAVRTKVPQITSLQPLCGPVLAILVFWYSRRFGLTVTTTNPKEMKIKTLIMAPIAITASALAADKTVLSGTMYFQNQGDLNIWQYLLETSTQRDVKNYQSVILREPGTWKFANPMRVKVITHYPELHQSQVSISNGRLCKSLFWIDDRSFSPTPGPLPSSRLRTLGWPE
ncbi:MAG: hypothetical protein WB586_20405 [Chthoniobacterales bacterium]